MNVGDNLGFTQIWSHPTARSNMATVLLTGGTGYIGSHTWLALQAAGHDVVGLDNLCNSSAKVLGRLHAISGRAPQFVQADVCDAAALRAVFDAHAFDAVVHFAALKAVGQSVAQPLAYYRNNIGGLLNLLEVMELHACKTLAFSSSATVYGQPESLPLREDSPLRTTNPYGATKLMSEDILSDLCRADPAWKLAVLRYFNPVGAHESGMIGEDPRGTPNNLMPYVAQVAVGKRAKLQVFGGEYATPDGTGVRDYIHVSDLAQGHVAALDYLLAGKGSITVNLGTGVGFSVLDLVASFEKACGKPIPYEIVARRPGDVPACYADASLAQRLLGWRAERDLDTMCADSWRWQQRNPNGFEAA